MATVFACSRGDGRPPCAYCGRKTDRSCVYQLGGRLAGQRCGTPVCEGCSGSTGLCRPHRRLRRERNVELAQEFDEDPSLVIAGKAGTHVIREEFDEEEAESRQQTADSPEESRRQK